MNISGCGLLHPGFSAIVCVHDNTQRLFRVGKLPLICNNPGHIRVQASDTAGCVAIHFRRSDILSNRRPIRFYMHTPNAPVYSITIHRAPDIVWASGADIV